MDPKQLLPLEALASYTYLSGLNLSSDGRFCGYVGHRGNLEENSYSSDLWVYAIQESANQPKKLTQSGKAASFIWLKESNVMIYPSTKDDKVKKAVESGEPLTVYYRIDPLGGESEEFFRLQYKVLTIEAIDDDRFLVLANEHPDYERFRQADDAKRREILSEWKEENDYEVIEEIPFWSNGGTFTRGSRNQLFLFTRSKNEMKLLTHRDDQVTYFHYDEDLEKVILIYRHYRGKMPLRATLALGTLEAGITEVLSEGDYALHYAYALDDVHLVFLGHDGSKYGLNQNPVFYKINRHTKDISLFNDLDGRTVGNTVGSDSRYGSKRSLLDYKGNVYFVTTDYENANLNRMDKTGQIEQLTHFKGSVDDFDWTEDILVINAMKENYLGEVYKVKKQSMEPLTSHNKWVNETYKLSTPEPVHIEREEGVSLDGWVIKPVDFDKTRKYPGILTIHGGPKTVYGTVFYHEMQYWVNRGFYVFFCNPRGSDGKGNAFSDIRGKYGTIDYDDIMAFTDAVLARETQLDQDRVYVTGGSYGGFMTNWIVGHTHRFKAAAAQRSISNWTTEYGVTDIGYYFVPDQIAATPWSDYEKLWDQSPLKYADRVKTPLLLIHSDQDYRCWVPEALQMFTALKDFGVQTRLCLFKGENHELSRSGKPKHRIRRIREITDWFEQL